MRRWLTFERAAVTIVLLLVFLIAVRPAVDNDLWFHLRTGQWIVDHHRIPGADPFSHTRPDAVRVQTDWVGQVGLYGLWRLGGGTLIALWVALLATAGTAAIFAATRGPLLVRLYVTALAAGASSIFWAARTQMSTFVLTAVTVAVLRRWRATPRLWWWLVPMFAVWANLHGGVVFGVLILWTTLLGERLNRRVGRVEPLSVPAWRTLAAVAGAATAVIVLNPSGARIYGLPFDQFSSSARFVEEVQPPSLGDAAAWPFFALLGFVVVAMWLGRRRLDAVDVLLVAGTGAGALRVVRGVPLFATVAAPVLARHVSIWLEGRARQPRQASSPSPTLLLTAVAVVAAVVTVGAAAELSSDRVDARLARDYPVAATEWLNSHRPPTELFNTFDWGGYLMFFAPGYRVSVDGRTDLYDDYLQTYADTVAAKPGYEAELDREGINTVLVDTDSPLAGALRADARWDSAYSDVVATVFVRVRSSAPGS